MKKIYLILSLRHIPLFLVKMSYLAVFHFSKYVEIFEVARVSYLLNSLILSKTMLVYLRDF